jgi:hypothetical protein
MGAIDDDPAGWWKKAKNKLFDLRPLHDYREGEFAFGSNANGFAAVSNVHADNHVLIIAGGNYATVVDVIPMGNSGHHTEEQQIALLKRVLDKKGYYISKKPRRKS